MTQRSDIGDKRSYMGIEFTATEYLKTYDSKPRGVRWIAGPIALSIDESWQNVTGHNWLVASIHCRTFEAAALRALKIRAAEVRKARELIAEYETCPDIIIRAAQAL